MSLSCYGQIRYLMSRLIYDFKSSIAHRFRLEKPQIKLKIPYNHCVAKLNFAFL